MRKNEGILQSELWLYPFVSSDRWAVPRVCTRFSFLPMHKSLKTRLGVKESHSEWLRSRLTLMQAIEQCNLIAICSVDPFVDWSCKTFVEMVLLVSVCHTEAQYLLHFIWHDRFTSIGQLVPQHCFHVIDLLSVCLIAYICQQKIVSCYTDSPRGKACASRWQWRTVTTMMVLCSTVTFTGLLVRASCLMSS